MAQNLNALAVQEAASDWTQREAIHKMLSELLINIADKYFVNRSLYVDGYRFINCTFENCDLWILRGTFEFHHCLFKNCKRTWTAEAMKCIQLHNLGNPNPPFSPVFLPKIYPDQTFSIGKDASVP